MQPNKVALPLDMTSSWCTNLWRRITDVARKPTDPTVGWEDIRNNVLSENNAKMITDRDSAFVWLEFETEEELTMFLLRWS